MAESWFHQIEKKTWNKLSIYVNVILFILVAVFVAMLILDSYKAGIASTVSYGDVYAWFNVIRDIAFLSVSLALIFFQFFRNLRIIVLRSW